MSNARNSAKLINKLTPTASGLNMTGTLDVSSNLVCQSNITLSGTSVITGGVNFSMVRKVHELNNSTPATSSSSVLNYDDSTITLTSPYADDGTNKSYRILIEAYGNARYLEDSDDPGFEPIMQLYNYQTAAWVNISDVDNEHRARWADRGSDNYNRQGYYISNNLADISTLNYVESYASPVIRMRINIAGVGGTAGDDLDAYYNHFRIWEFA